ncbi:HNH endonuclease [Neorhizobium galegae]|uniref:HNH endonuclease n=1 Tax=Neorhizobium galegae TaxID=399 RepID=UPI0021061F3E|nr:HNH endonuclease [Neorhizobium galegae]MCQ1779123.1 HNH endonuclease [Neorhizobium galegae]MCQ1799202.1 HNH endonuclease [Neorhizobium galegae]
MPVTKGAGNPDWTWDETLLALDLFYRHGTPLDKHHADIRALSDLLRAAEIYPKEGRKDNFRNPDGVALKTQNLQSAINPERRLSSSRTDRAIVSEFPLARKSDVAEIAALISRELFSHPQPEDVPDDEMFVEGQVITACHRRRDRRLRRRLLDKCVDNELICAVCDFRPPALSRDLRESFFEAHHLVPLALATGTTTTHVRDMALLCAGCHRFLHRLISSRKRWVGVPEARFTISGGMAVDSAEFAHLLTVA